MSGAETRAGGASRDGVAVRSPSRARSSSPPGARYLAMKWNIPWSLPYGLPESAAARRSDDDHARAARRSDDDHARARRPLVERFPVLLYEVGLSIISVMSVASQAGAAASAAGQSG